MEVLPGLNLCQHPPLAWFHRSIGSSSHDTTSVADFHTVDVSLVRYESQSNTSRAKAIHSDSSEMRAKRRADSSEGGGEGTRASGAK